LLALPLALATLWPAWRVLLTLKRAPARFAGLRLVRAGAAACAFVAVAITLLIGITVPERLHQRALAQTAAQNAVAYEVSSVILRYQTRYGTYPTSADDLRMKLPDPDGAVTRVAELMGTSAYEPVSDIASLPPAGTKSRPRRVAAVRVHNASLRTGMDDTPDEGLSFTSYKLTLPGPDRKLGTSDDIILRDGRIVPQTASPTRTNKTTTP
jgi:hypothetical protein